MLGKSSPRGRRRRTRGCRIFLRSREISVKLGDRSKIALRDRDIGRTHLTPRRARGRRSRRSKRRWPPSSADGDRRARADANNYLGHVWQALDEPTRAIEAYTSGRERRQGDGPSDDSRLCPLEMLANLRRRGEYAEGLRGERGRDRAARGGRRSRPRRRGSNQLGNVYRFQRRLHLAVTVLETPTAVPSGGGSEGGRGLTLVFLRDRTPERVGTPTLYVPSRRRGTPTRPSPTPARAALSKSEGATRLSVGDTNGGLGCFEEPPRRRRRARGRAMRKCSSAWPAPWRQSAGCTGQHSTRSRGARRLGGRR